MAADLLRVKSVFLAAADLEDPAQRAAYLDGACGADADLRSRVEALLRANDAAPLSTGKPLSATCDYTPPPRPAADAALDPRAVLGTVLAGRYKLVEVLGEGGMGAVYLAHQTEPVRRDVAVKVIKAGMDSRSILVRFEAERQALALMDHPNIAKVLDAGATPDGRPYFVMELVKGTPITTFCDQRRLTPRQRLELFVGVCQAIQHAHTKGIIHRDIKPSNVLVALYDGRPVPKVIDFGVAKAAGPRLTERTLFTEFGAVVGTLEYMSPEQAELNNQDIDTRADIYSLGVLLYELLTGTTPLERKRLKQATFLETLRMIREEEPPRPSTRLSASKDTLPWISAQRQTDPQKLTRLMRGELDWIVMKALEKDRSRRYETANALARDVEYYLRDEPVLACPPSLGYRLRKLVRRNKRALAAGTVLVVSLLVGLAAVAGSVGWAARDRASRQEEATQAIRRTLKDARLLYRQGRLGEALAAVRATKEQLPGAGDRDDLRREYERVKADLEMLTRVESARLKALGGASKTNQAYREAFREYGVPVPDLPTAEAARRLIASAIAPELVTALDDWTQRVASAEEKANLLAVAQAADADPWRKRIRQAILDRDEKAIFTLARDAKVKDLPPASVLLLVSALRGLDNPPRPVGNFVTKAFPPPAVARGREGELLALEVLRRAQPYHLNDFWINLQLGYSLIFGGGGTPQEANEAVGFLRVAQASRPHSPEISVLIGMGLSYRGTFRDAEQQLRRTLKLLRPGQELQQSVYAALGNVLVWKGDRKGGIAAYRKGLKLALAQGRTCFTLQLNLGIVLARDGQRAEAEVELRKAVRLQPDFFAAHKNLIQLLEGQQKVKAAEAGFRAALAHLPENAEFHLEFAKFLARHSKNREAEAEVRELLRLDPKNAEGHGVLGFILGLRGKFAQAEAHLRKSIRLKPDNALNHFILGETLNTQGKWEKAEKEFKEGVRLSPNNAEYALHLAQFFLGRGKRSEAITAFRSYLVLKPDDLRGHGSLCKLLLKEGNLTEAETAHREAVRLNPKSAQLHNGLGAFLCDRQHYYTGAEAAFREAIRLQPDFAEAHCNLGVALLRQRKPAEAEQAIREAFRLKPGFLRFQGPLAEALYDQGKFREAADAYGKAVEQADGLVKSKLRMRWALSLAKAGDHARALAEAQALTKAAKTPGPMLYDAACVYGVSLAARKGQAELREEHAARALALLRRARGAGIFKEPGMIEHLKKDPDLAPLRSRKEFQKFVAELEAGEK
jgi:serine/threonine protein kinase/Tfp pilus assembly protein PilF